MNILVFLYWSIFLPLYTLIFKNQIYSVKLLYSWSLLKKEKLGLTVQTDLEGEKITIPKGTILQKIDRLGEYSSSCLGTHKKYHHPEYGIVWVPDMYTEKIKE